MKIFFHVFAEVAAAWLETLLDVIDLLPTEIIKKDVGPFVFSVLLFARDPIGLMSSKFDFNLMLPAQNLMLSVP